MAAPMNFNCTRNFFTVIFLAFLCGRTFAQTNVITQHNDLSRTGWNNKEITLNTKNVKTGLFGKLFSRNVDDQIYAQLLVVRSVLIPGYGNKNIVFAATVNNTVYAFDADSANITAPYWKVNLTPPGLRPVKNSDMTGACGGNYKDFSGNMGIVGTPVIDTLTKTLYVVARSTSTSTTGYVQYLHALDITNGNEKSNSPKLITAQIAGTGQGSVGGVLTFNSQKQNQRCGLLLLNGKVYICYASHCDWDPYHGWVLGYDKITLNQTNVYSDTPDGYEGGIWMSGAAPSADEYGNIYVASGNGTTGSPGNISDIRNRSTSALKLTPSGGTLTTSSFFTPNNYSDLNSSDLDFGTSQMMLVPNTNQVMVASKDGKIYLMDRDNLGGYNSISNNVAQTIDLGNNAHLHASLAYYKGSQKEFVYCWSENTSLKAFPYDHTINKLNLANTVSSGVQGPVGSSGAFLSVSSNGSVDSTAILWTTFAATGDANTSVRPGILHAFDASDVTKELWNSSQDTADDPGDYAKFNCPTIANGKVYLASFSKKFLVYGLKSSASACNSADLALNRPAVSSSNQNDTYTADKAFDGDPTTRWGSLGQSDPQYIYVDLGSRYNLCSVLLKWEVALGKDFTIDVSDDAVNWVTLATKTNNVNFVNYIPVQGSGRYVRMYGTARGTNYGYSLYSFEVYGTPVITCPAPDGLSVTNIDQTSANIHWNSNGAKQFNVQYKTVAAADWITVAVNANNLILTDLDCGADYHFRIQAVCSSADMSDYSGATSFSTLLCDGDCSPLPTRWTTQDIGNTAIPGSACYTPDVFTLKGSGDDIGRDKDAFRYALQTLVGDGEFSARVISMDQSNPLNKCGIMIRETLSAGSKSAFIGLTSGNGALFQVRSETDGNTSTVNALKNCASPYWIKLFKEGSTYSAFVSPDGINYSPVGSPVDAGFGNGVPIYAGLAITSHDNSLLSTATVDKYKFSSGVLPVKLLSFTAAINLAHKVDLNWSTTQEMNTKYFVIERGDANYHFVAIDSVKANNNGSFTTLYYATDDYPTGAITFYRLKIVDANGHSTYSAYVMLRLGNFKAPLVYPNPAKTFINIVQGSEPVKHVTIYDISGKAILRSGNSGTGYITNISTNGLPRATYIVEITTESNVYRDKLLIQ